MLGEFESYIRPPTYDIIASYAIPPLSDILASLCILASDDILEKNSQQGTPTNHRAHLWKRTGKEMEGLVARDMCKIQHKILVVCFFLRS